VRAFVVAEESHQLACEVRDVDLAPVDADDVLVAVEYSSVNFKDAMVASAPSRVRRVASLVGGVDAAGVVEASSIDGFKVGELVAVHGGNLGVARDGGFATHVYAPARYLSALPAPLSARDAMVLGTAGFTAMASVLALEDRGLVAGARVVVSGATGGVGSQSVHFLAVRGYQPVASTGSADHAEWLRELGAVEVIGRDELSDLPGRVLGTERWDGAIDSVGGAALASILRSLRYGAAVAASGLVASAELDTTLYPFITRGVALLGIDAVEANPSTRARVWRAVAEIAPRVDFARLVDRVVTLEQLPEALEDIRRGATRGRILVRPTP
jgi:putative YhdH/YhfP family quinone oxidoreductase